VAENIAYIYRIIDKFSTPAKKISAAVYKVGDAVKRTQPALRKFGEKAKSVEGALAGAGLGAALALVTSKAMDFEDVMTDVRKVTEFKTEDQFRAFREGLLKTSVVLGKTPVALAAIAEQGGKLGILPQHMNDFIDVVAKTSVAFGMMESTAGETIGKLKSMFELTVGETGNLMDAVNFLADNTTSSGEQMIEIIKRTSGTFKTFKMPTEFIAGWASFANQIETTSELAASGLNMMASRMTQIPGMLEKMIKDPNKAMRDMLISLSKMDKIDRTRYIYKTFGQDAAKFVMKAVESTQALASTMDLVSDKTSFSGSMMKELEKKLKTGKTAWAKMKAVVDILAITLGDVLLPYVKEVAPKIVKAGLAFREWSKAHPKIVKIGLAIAAITAVVGPLLFAIGMMSLAIGAISLPMVAVAAAVVAVVGGLYLLYKGISYVIKNWDKMVQAMKDFGKWWVDKFTFDSMVNGIEKVVEKIRPLIDSFYKLDEKLGFGSEKKKVAVTAKEADEKWAKVVKMRREMGLWKTPEKGVAATNAGAVKNNLNGQIVVAPAKGAQVNSASMTTDVPGNLGFNIAAGVTP